MLRLKIDFEDSPIIDLRKPVNEEEFDGIIGGIKNKLFGRSR